jgi:phage gpG-like protein
MSLSFSISGPAIADLQRVRSKLHDLSELVTQLGEMQHQMTMEDYGAQVSPDGAGWVGGPNYHGLVETGAMMGGITLSTGGNTATITASDAKSPWHNFGTSRGIPPRPFIGIGARHESKLKETAEQWLQTILG